ncbi:MAG: type I DNA topoisomerase [Oscillospiraceae bacterium]|nr:type I DNA topoisomerase [Oscillospiraceae bacterium]
MAKAKNLVIVESPAKAKTIGKYLGPDYQVKASMGHLRDLPKSTLGVDVDGDFTPNYKPIKGKEDIIKDLKTAAKGSQTVYLATDPDREGEAISWHLKYLLELPDEKARRVTFNEITKKVVTDSIQHPRDIDQDLVDAQQARRVLDRIVGYQLSPLLWKKIRRGLSAGRVQSVAMRLVAEREKEITDFVPQEYWTLDASLKNHAGALFTAHYYGKGGKKYEPSSEGDTQAIMDELRELPFTVSSVKRADKQRSPAPPFTTSTLQQEASRKLNMTPRRTMAIAQQLYEGVDITGEGTVGLITYMRTDSLRISAEAQAQAKTVICSRYGECYYPASTRAYKTKAGAQDAHEAIRPSDPALTPEQVKGDLTGEQYRLYRLIWSRFLASQMANAVYDSISVEIGAGDHSFRCSASNLKFAGYTAVYEESRDDDKEEKESPLPELAEGESVTLESFAPAQHFTQPPARYTDATLIRTMEENGIGRPSTYAPTVSTILDREYVIKEGKYLRITPLGQVVNDLMCQRFPNIVDVKFTARMEKKLDDVESGDVQWKDVIRQFYVPFHENLEQVEKDMEGVYLKVPDEVTEEKCDLCGRNMVIKSGRFGRFLACPGYPECKFTKPLVVEMPGRCPKCGGRILKKTSRNGYTYYGCDKFPTCDFMTWDVPVKDDCPVCGQTMFKKAGRGFNKPFCANPACSNFLPEDKRGYRRRKTADGAENAEGAAETAAAAEDTAKKTTKTAAKKTTTAKTTKTAAAKKTAKTAEKEPAAKKTTRTAAKKTTTKSTAAKKTTKKAAEKAE